MKIVTLDFETYFDSTYSLRNKDYNTSDYIRDPQFYVHCVGIKHSSNETEVFWDEDVEPALREIDWSKSALLCHHTQFDGFILAERYGIVPMFYLDTLSMARALHNNQIKMGLDSVGEFYGIGNKLQNVLSKMKGHRVIPDTLRPDATAYTKMDVDLCYALARAMMKVFPEAELRLIDLTIRMFTQPALRVDLVRVQKELDREIQEKAALVQAAGVSPEELQSAGKLAQVLADLGVDPPRKISPRTGEETFAFSQQDEDFVALGSHPDERVRKVVAARLAIKSTLGESRAQRFLRAGDQGRALPVYLNYCGAHTTRWSGGNKLNLQNLPRGGELRKSLLAPPGQAVVVADSAQIEARILGWLARQEDLLAIFREKGDPYCALATEIYGREITKADKLERFVGKVARLGLGYYMGARRFQGTLALGLMGPPVDLPIEECQRIVRAFRRTNPMIVKLWDRMDRTLEHMVMKRVNGVRDDYTVIMPGVLEYDEQSIWLPNGLGLHYPDLKGEYDPVREKMSNFSFRATKEFVTIHSGLLTENVTQALARVVIGEQMLAIADKWQVVTMTHDEVVALAPKEKAEECLDDMLRIMATPPAWAPDLPLGAEGGFDVIYSK